MNNYRDLKIWQEGMGILEDVYKTTNSFPGTERYSLTDQIRRSAVSIPSNIAEGSGRNSQLEFNRFLSFASGSACELSTQIEIALRLGYIPFDEAKGLLERIAEEHKMIYGLQASIKRTLKPKSDRSYKNQ